MYSRSSSAYELDWDYGIEEVPARRTAARKTAAKKNVKKNTKKNVKKKSVKSKSKVKILSMIPFSVKATLVAFFALSLICYRCVYIYGLHKSVDNVSAQLETITMENEQMTIAINSQIDSAKIAEYAQKHLGLQKIDDRQIIYLTGDTKDSMGKIAKADEKSKNKGSFGFLASVTEYLR